MKDVQLAATACAACTWAHAGGGAHKYSEIFKEKLGVLLEKEDEMMCLVRGCNFFLKAITHEAFTYENGTTRFVPTNGAWPAVGVQQALAGWWGPRG